MSLRGIPLPARLWHDPCKTNEQFNMSQRLSISSSIFFILIFMLGLYFAFAAVQGPSGILRRVQVESEAEELMVERQRLQKEVSEMQNLTHRLSDEYLDLDLLDERAREVLGLIRPDEIIIQ